MKRWREKSPQLPDLQNSHLLFWHKLPSSSLCLCADAGTDTQGRRWRTWPYKKWWLWELKRSPNYISKFLTHLSSLSVLWLILNLLLPGSLSSLFMEVIPLSNPVQLQTRAYTNIRIIPGLSPCLSFFSQGKYKLTYWQKIFFTISTCQECSNPAEAKS